MCETILGLFLEAPVGLTEANQRRSGVNEADAKETVPVNPCVVSLLKT